MTPALKKELMAAMDENAEAFRLLREAASTPECRYTYEFKGPNTQLPTLSKIKKASQLLRLKTYALVESGETSEAVQVILDNVSVTRSLDEDPFLISHLVQAEGDGVCENAAQRLLNRASPPLDQLRRLDDAFKSMDPMAGFKRSIVAERCMAIDVMTTPAEVYMKQYGGDANMGALDLAGYRESALFNEDFLLMLDFWENYEKAFSTPFPENMAVAQAINRLVDTARDNH